MDSTEIILSIPVKMGDKYRDRAGLLHHVRTVIEDDGGSFIITRSWAKYENRWIYVMTEEYRFKLEIKFGLLERVK